MSKKEGRGLSKEFLEDAASYLAPLIRRAGKMARDKWGKAEIKKYKEGRDLVTKIEIEIENFFKNKILSKWPEHGFYGEETRRINASSDFQWLIDPIDGTKYYVANAPLFYVHAALLFRNEPVLGVIYNPVSKQLFCASKGTGAYLNGKRILLKSPVKLGKAMVDVDIQGLIGKQAKEKKWLIEELSEIMKKCYRVRITSGALGIYIATGAIDAYVDLAGAKPQDLAARIIIMREAGCKAEYIETPFGKRLIASREPIFSGLKEILLK
ncbi:MAG: inositol monophosphatase [Candidatus Diapherotrites archaeon]|nr:inositol monophosphatase [Candidatus Diapherotrites archaeon]